MHRILAILLQLSGPFRSAIQNGDTEQARGICRIVVSLGDSHIRTILFAPTEDDVQNVQEFLRFLLECTSVPGSYPLDETISEMTSYLWFLFLDELSSIEPEASH